VNRTTIEIGQNSKPEIRQQLIGIVAHQFHETFDIAAQPGPDDRVGAYPEIVRKFGRPARIAIAMGDHPQSEVPDAGDRFSLSGIKNSVVPFSVQAHEHPVMVVDLTA
jgi:hypothetical protein